MNRLPVNNADDAETLSVELLEKRMMLSTVTIFAAGHTGEESMALTGYLYRWKESAAYRSMAGS